MNVAHQTLEGGRKPNTHIFKSHQNELEGHCDETETDFIVHTVQNIREMFARYIKRAEAEVVGAGGRLKFIVIDLSS